MSKYLLKKLSIYFLTFFIAVTMNWIVPRVMPGDPVTHMVVKFSHKPESFQKMKEYISGLYGLDKPLYVQYLNFWVNLFKGDLGISIKYSPRPVISVILEALPYTISVLLPGVLISWFVGNWFGAFAARRKRLDTVVLPMSYVLMSAPQFWLGLLLVWLFGFVWPIFPYCFAYSEGVVPGWNFSFIQNYFWHWVLPFMSLFLMALGGWAIGMRNMIIYELEANYSRYLEALGASEKLIRKYAYHNALLPQITGLALQLGVLVAGDVVLEIVFNYPGVGYRFLQGLKNLDYFLMQGCFITEIFLTLFFNFTIDIIYMFVDPRIKSSYGGAQ